jgi:hypothetical protein
LIFFEPGASAPPRRHGARQPRDQTLPGWRNIGVVTRAFLLVNALAILAALVPARDWSS